MSRLLACTLRDARGVLAHEVHRRLGAGQAFSVTVPFAQRPAEEWLSFLPERPTACWLSPGEADWLGWDEALVLGPGPDAVPGSPDAVAFPGLEPVPPRFLGGMAFDPDREPEAPWQCFGRGRFVLPRWLYRRDPAGTATLTLFAVPGDSRQRLEQAVEEDFAHWRAVSDAGTRGPSPDTAVAPERRPDEPRNFEALVGRALDAIASGRLDKVVLARRAVVEDVVPIDPGRVLAALAVHAPASTRFAVRAGKSTFVGASPERLLLRRGAHLRTEAVAGTRALAGGDAQALSSELLASAKDRSEHEWTVRGLLESLAPCCVAMDRPDVPVVRQHGHVMHLVTPIDAQIGRNACLRELARIVHPTPAVGGYPSRAALDWLRENEPIERGWFAGPVGWFDAEGNGEFRVALRSGLIRGHRLDAYAGAGIVRDSEPPAEAAEIEAKLQPVLRAAGFRP